MNDLVRKAWNFAKEAHKGQIRDDGLEYFGSHLVQVWLLLKNLNNIDVHLECAALLHDTIEDTDTTYEDLIRVFNKDIADLVMEVTHEGQKDEHGYYFPRLKTKRGIILKFADRLSNLVNINVWNEKRQQQYLRKSKFWKDK